MARSDLLKKMLASYQRGDNGAFRAAARQLIGDERTKRHHLLADELERLLDTTWTRRPLHSPSLRPLPMAREDSLLLDLVDPHITFEHLVLTADLYRELMEVIREIHARDVLGAAGLRPRSRLLFVGPPGTGKSATAEAIASELGLPLAIVRLGAVVSSRLGETARNVEAIFEFCSHGTWVLLFDEVDSFAKERSDSSDHGELKRVVTAFLQLLDAFRGSSLVIATTNHPKLLDSAVWRRFDDVFRFGLPDEEAVRRLLSLKLTPSATRFNREPFVALLKDHSQADIERVCQYAVRHAILAGRSTVETTDFQLGLDRLRNDWQAIPETGFLG